MLGETLDVQLRSQLNCCSTKLSCNSCKYNLQEISIIANFLFELPSLKISLIFSYLLLRFSLVTFIKKLNSIILNLHLYFFNGCL